ncbi:MAG: heavy-metal-associated domain-containing protein [Acholeplasmataceae bacterium]|nr:heavy-metal-associated domain-containing protein [Acholeplasmataceae bacterium]
MKIKVSGMNCMHCSKRVSAALKELGLKKVKVDLDSGIVTFKENKNVSSQLIEQTIIDIGYQIG